MNATENQGLLMPLLAYRFRVRVENDPGFEITKQVLNCSIDYVNSHIHLSIVQPATDNEVHSIIKTMCNRPTQNIYVEHLRNSTDGKEPKIEFTNVFNGCKAIKHELKLDYARNDKACHDLVLKFESHTGM